MYSVPTVDTDREGCNVASEDLSLAFDGVAALGLSAAAITGESTPQPSHLREYLLKLLILVADTVENGPIKQVVTIQEGKYLVNGKEVPSVPQHERCTACARRHQECSGWDGVPCAACLSSGGRKCSKSQITGSTGATTYNGRPVYAEPPCGHCLKKGFDCTGLPLGRCDSCRDLRHRCSRSMIQTRLRQKDSSTFSIVPYLKSQISLLPEDIRYRITYNIRGVDISVDILPPNLRPQTSDSESDTSVVPLGWIEFQSTDVCPVVELGRPGDVWIRSPSENSTQPSSEVVYVCGELDGNGAAQWSLVSSEQLHQSTRKDPLRHPLVRGCVFGRSETLRYCWREISDEPSEPEPIIGNKRALDTIADTADITIAAPPGAKRSRQSQDPHSHHVHFSPFVIVRHCTPLSPLPSRFQEFATQTKPKKRSPRRPRGQIVSFDGDGAATAVPLPSGEAQNINTQAIASTEGKPSLEVEPRGTVSAGAPAGIDSPGIRLSDSDHIITPSESNPSDVPRDMSSENTARVELSAGGDLSSSESSLPARLPVSDTTASLTSSPNDQPNSGTITHTPTYVPSPTDSNSRATTEDGPQTIMASMEGGVTTLWKVLSQVHGGDFDAVMIDTCEGLVLVLQQLQGKYRASIADESSKGS
ncbi:uncharacterized protein STEHIDRAFT_158403 [Stereum hirsutum FP-91666 SS1]|uniref:uncharacterized protein n=1 Tax=Stereum hirsutum (strain FP-91666) TaxID=721885 RepID=UPI000444A7B9|nr:uncharacterized protein STEHIDRAFT_158403 [Stereum hirsutum FP-91666 SS1]EIM84686.1 hypothetical protein STEHIDRAFT_158403 [Stereum hirsutum FP-91666 SS1]